MSSMFLENLSVPALEEQQFRYEYGGVSSYSNNHVTDHVFYVLGEPLGSCIGRTAV